MKSIILTGLAAIVLAGCSVAYGGEVIEQQGIYECSPGAGFSAPTYSFDSRSEDTSVWLGSDHGFEFRDLETGEMVRIYFGSTNLVYTCELIRDSPS